MAKPFNTYKDLKVLEKTHKKFFKAKNLKEFQVEGKVTVTAFLEHLLETEMSKFDNITIEKIKNNKNN